jgi:hypothetical protein
MQTTQHAEQLRNEIISATNMLPLDGLKLLAEFIAFLKAKFNLDSQLLSLEEAEDRALAKAIDDGWTGESVSRTEIFEVLADTE